MLKPPTSLKSPQFAAAPQAPAPQFSPSSSNPNPFLGQKRKLSNLKDISSSSENKKLAVEFEGKASKSIPPLSKTILSKNAKFAKRLSKRLSVRVSRDKISRLTQKPSFKAIPLSKPSQPTIASKKPSNIRSVPLRNAPNSSRLPSKQPASTTYKRPVQTSTNPNQRKIATLKNSINASSSCLTNLTDDEAEPGPPELPKGHAIDFKIRSSGYEKVANYWKDKCRSLKSILNSLDSSFSSTLSQTDDLKNQLSSSKKELSDKLDSIKSLNLKISDLQAQIISINNSNQEILNSTISSHNSQLAALNNEKSALQNQIDSLTSNLKSTKLLLENEIIKSNKLTDTQLVVENKLLTIKDLEENIKQKESNIEDLKNTLAIEEITRRKLHNTIQELKGNIRENATGQSIPKTTDFEFDHVFLPDESQDVVYGEVSQLIQSALDGYSVCIFAYGQTGSGKTFTMEGPDEINSPSDRGIIPRALEQIYSETLRLSNKGWAYELGAQFVEIYNEQLFDLLCDTTADEKSQQVKMTRKQASSDAQITKPATKIEIRQGPDGSSFVSGCSITQVDSANSVSSLLTKAALNRRVASTDCNERSSRSHCVFTLFIKGKNSQTGESCNSMLNLIDLAGSERLNSSKSTGDRLKETQAINKSLSSLGDVIMALSNGEKHIPFRNSKLTHLLMPSLSAGNSKIMMFVCVAPDDLSSQETLCSLRFAAKVNNCHIGTAKRHN
ncbi:Kinesin-2 [Smittium culicis]|uniref:Kinesin-like protein n=1 Tax=Smittium culicis TaxID=133412 RepID=A0A1R1Y693_9FUNG|nr:Kinesin-2 [Smittium culicis]